MRMVVVFHIDSSETQLIACFVISGIEAACASASALSCTFSSVAGRSFAARESMICCVTTGLPVISSNCSFRYFLPMEDCDSMLFNQNLPIAFESGKSSFSLNKNDSNAMAMETGIGQGKTLVSPLHMALIASAVEKDDSIVCKDASGKEITIPCDSVISSAGYIPNPLAPKGSNVSLVGDCDGVGNLRSVVWRAYEVAMKI